MRNAQQSMLMIGLLVLSVFSFSLVAAYETTGGTEGFTDPTLGDTTHLDNPCPDQGHDPRDTAYFNECDSQGTPTDPAPYLNPSTDDEAATDSSAEIVNDDDNEVVEDPTEIPIVEVSNGASRGSGSSGGNGAGAVVNNQAALTPLSTTPSEDFTGSSAEGSEEVSPAESAPITGFAVGGNTKRNVALVAVFLAVIICGFFLVRMRKK